ncbi:MAG: hypothetical protein ABSC94_32680 [Polyangiaceae bacterium]|jgi:hypothetical protein
MPEEYESVVMPAGQLVEIGLEAISRARDELLHQTAIVSMNLEFLVQSCDGEKKAAAQDAQTSLARIVEIIRAIQAAPSAMPSRVRESA